MLVAGCSATIVSVAASLERWTRSCVSLAQLTSEEMQWVIGKARRSRSAWRPVESKPKGLACICSCSRGACSTRRRRRRISGSDGSIACLRGQNNRGPGVVDQGCKDVRGAGTLRRPDLAVCQYGTDSCNGRGCPTWHKVLQEG